MKEDKRRPAYWQLWLLFPVLGMLTFLETRAVLSAAGHRIVEVSLVLAVFGLVFAWLRANRLAIIHETDAQGLWREVTGTTGLTLEASQPVGDNGDGHGAEWDIPAGLPETESAASERRGER